MITAVKKIKTSYKHYKRGKLQVDKDACPHCAVRKAHEIRKITGKTTMAKSRYNKLKQENFILKTTQICI